MKSLLAYIPILLLAGCGTKTNPTDTWSKYVQIKIDWKNDLAELLLKHTPEHEELINIQRDLQIAYIKQRTIKYRFLQAKLSTPVEMFTTCRLKTRPVSTARDLAT